MDPAIFDPAILEALKFLAAVCVCECVRVRARVCVCVCVWKVGVAVEGFFAPAYPFAMSVTAHYLFLQLLALLSSWNYLALTGEVLSKSAV